MLQQNRSKQCGNVAANSQQKRGYVAAKSQQISSKIAATILQNCFPGRI
jgi:hypothetical protein